MSAPVKDLLNAASQWPASFPQPNASTRVLTYVFNSTNSSKVELLLKYIKDKYPKALVSIVKDNAGFTSVSITQSKPKTQGINGEDGGQQTQSASADCAGCSLW